MTMSLVLASCGYHLVGRGGALPEGVKSVGVPMFENQTRKAEVEQRFTEQMVEELSTRSDVRILSGAEGADALLRGVITGYETSPVVLTSEGRASRYEVTVTASVRLEDLRESRMLWANDQFVFRRQYEVESDLLPGAGSDVFFDQEIVAIEVVAREFADSVVTAILEGF
jgi:outer membrane lipopolysaccharide assembly protein LptE/RlpB